MYLSIVNPKLTFASVRGEDNAQEAHKNVQSMFSMKREDGNILFCKAPTKLMPYRILVQSDIAPESTENMTVMKCRNVDEWNASLKNGTYLRFSVLARPMKGNNSRHTPLYGEEEQMQWFIRQAEKNGFDVEKLQMGREEVKPFRHDRKKNTKRITLNGRYYNGVLKITDIEKFNYVYRHGLGRGKAYGFGMMMLYPMSN